MNIAILIGVSEYATQNKLPACAKDVEHMRSLLEATKKYEEIKCIQKQTNASQVKDELWAFFSKYEKSDISEALIYFSGHGYYHTDAMLCCSDFDINKPNTTSISNTNIDDLLRSVNPSVAVKIIDACQSGSPYIKDTSDGFQKSLKVSRLDSFLCMMSSRQNQLSYASAHESDFTKSWIDAALSKKTGRILYRDIEAFLADAFLKNPDQTPFFVNQGTVTEVFSMVTDDMLRLSNSRSKSVDLPSQGAAIDQRVAAEISKMDKKYVSQAAVNDALNLSYSQLNEQDIDDKLITKYYKKYISNDLMLELIPNVIAVAVFADDQGWTNRYLLKVHYQQKNKKWSQSNLSLIETATLLLSEKKPNPLSIKSTESLPFEVVSIRLSSTHDCLLEFIVYVGIVHSRTDVMVLSSIVSIPKKGWEDSEPEPSDVEWRYTNYSWESIVAEPSLLWREAFDRCESEMRKYLESFAHGNESLTKSIQGKAKANI